METLIKTRFHWQRPVLLALFAFAALGAAIFGLRTYRSFLLLRSAYELGAPDVGSVRPWMTLDYVARAYHVPETELVNRLGLTPDTNPATTLISLAQKQDLSPFAYLRQVQEAISELRPITSPPGGNDAVSEPGGFGDEILAALLVYGSFGFGCSRCTRIYDPPRSRTALNCSTLASRPGWGKELDILV